MEYNDSGSSGSGSWSSYDVPYMWGMLREHDSTPHQKAIDGWRRSYELVLIHRVQVEKYKEKLVQAWPPERNKASRAYVERLDYLIESLTETYEASIANYTAFSSAISAVDSAKVKLNTIQEEYARNEKLLGDYHQELRDRPVAYGKAVAPPPPKSPVADGRQTQLHQEASTLMDSLSVELAQAKFSLVAPKPYSPETIRKENSESLDPSGSGAIIPTVTPSFSGQTSSRTRSSKSIISHPGKSIISAKPGGGIVGGSGSPKPPSEGPILGGAKPHQPSPATGPAITTPPVTPTTHSPGPYTISPLTPTPSTSTSLPPTTTNPSVGTSLPVNGTAGTTGVRGNVLPNGNIIGGTPHAGGPSGRVGQPGAAARGLQRTNPVGGMIGQGTGAPNGRRPVSREEEESRRHRWDPDNPWETETGINPILLPSEQQRIDPGPTIGGR